MSSGSEQESNQSDAPDENTESNSDIPEIARIAFKLLTTPNAQEPLSVQRKLEELQTSDLALEFYAECRKAGLSVSEQGSNDPEKEDTASGSDEESCGTESDGDGEEESGGLSPSM